jgi:histidine triad (HIT) family protein
MIQSRAPKDYVCPICTGIKSGKSEDTLIRDTDFVYEDDLVTAFINSFFMGKNAGHVVVLPKEHYESIYTIPEECGHRIFDVSQKIAVAMKEEYGCDGITLRQNNEPAGDQHAFHYHLHVFPRYDNDGFNKVQPEQKRLAEPDERKEYADRIKAALKNS